MPSYCRTRISQAFQPLANCVVQPSTPVDTANMSVLIVGASVAGVRTAQALRAADYAGDITMIGEELHRPYDKPPLTKAMLDPHGDGAQVPLLSDDDLEALTIDLQLGVRALSLDPARRVVTTDLMQDLTYKNLVIATGVTPRPDRVELTMTRPSCQAES